MRKRTVALLVILAALMGLAVSQAVLSMAGRIRTDNVITYGSLKMRLHETDEAGREVAMSGGEALRLRSKSGAQPVTRVITAENICDETMYLRMRLSIGGTSADGKTFMLSEEEVAYAANETGGWEAGGDGWYYYHAVLAPGGSTAPLLAEDKLTFQTDVIAETHPNEALSLSVDVQAVQSKNNGPDARSAQGWPEEVAKP